MTGQYKVISDNLGEYSVVSKDNVLVATEIQHRITAETFCEELNILAEENEQLKSENNMLRVTIGRNEAYIGRLTHQSEWSNEAKNTSISSRRCKGDKEI